MKIIKICCLGTAVQSHNYNIAVPWVGQYGEILPTQSCNNIYVAPVGARILPMQRWMAGGASLHVQCH